MACPTSPYFSEMAEAARDATQDAVVAQLSSFFEHRLSNSPVQSDCPQQARVSAEALMAEGSSSIARSITFSSQSRQTSTRWSSGRQISEFLKDRRLAAEHIYCRVHIFAAGIAVFGTFLVILGIYVLDTFWYFGGSAAICLGNALVCAGIVILSACDPADTNLDAMLRTRHGLRTFLGISFALLFGVAGFIHGLLLYVVVAIISCWGVITGSAMTAVTHGVSVLALSTSFTVENWTSVMTPAARPWSRWPGCLGFLVLQVHRWRHHIPCQEQGDQQSFEATKAFYIEMYMYLLFLGLWRISAGIEGAYLNDELPATTARHLVSGTCCFVPPAVLACMGKDWVFSVVARRIDGDPGRRMKDAAFVAQLLDSMRVEVGEDWWQFRAEDEDKDQAYPATDHRHHFRRGEVISVQRNAFNVRYPSDFDAPPEIVTFTMGGREAGLEELTEMSRNSLRCMSWDDLTLDLLASGPICGAGDPALAANRFLQMSRPVHSGERIDFFISHCWYDDPNAKYEVLCAVSQDFKRQHGRDPTYWLDKTCLDQANIVDGLRTLPLTVMACDHLLMILTHQYSKRLWCVWELFAIMAFSRLEQAIEKILPIVHPDAEPNAEEEAYEILCQFQAKNARCFDPNDEKRLRKVIAAVGEERFNWRIQKLGEVCRTRDRQKLISHIIRSSESGDAAGTRGKTAAASSCTASDEHSIQDDATVSCSSASGAADIMQPDDRVSPRRVIFV